MKVFKLLALILVLSLTLSLASATAVATAPTVVAAVGSGQTILLDGNEVNAEVYTIGGYNFFKLRDIAQLMNGTGSRFSVDFNPIKKTITAKTGESYTAVGGELDISTDKSATCVASDWKLVVDGLTVSFSVYSLGGNNFFKLRDLGTAFGFAIEYDNTTNSAIITSGRYSLVFNDTNYTVKTLELDGQTITYRAYENIIYVSNPVDTKYQALNFFVPDAYYKGESIGNYNANTAPIFFPNTVGGYMPGAPGSPGLDRNGNTNAAFMALSKGYVVAAPGARGRTLKDEGGMYTGKAPACIVDLKAAVRYLRYNDLIMPGNAERIVSNGTSAGGALSSLLGATGNNKDYEPYLEAIGAADKRDDIFAVSAYCPITNLDNADIAYEWLFNGINDYTRMVFSPPTDGQFKPLAMIPDTMTADQLKISDELKALFPAYLNGLELKKADGLALTLDAKGDGTFKDYVKSFVIVSAQKALNGGTDLSDLTWMTIKDGTVTDIDFYKYAEYATRMKPAPAFDGLDAKRFENNLFGTATIDNLHFTQFAKDNSTVNGSMAEAAIVKMLNPMNYIGTDGTTTSQYWRIRHGTKDRDTSIAVPVMLATKLQNKGFDVDFAMPWDRGHAGDYDLAELFAWIDKVCD